MKPIQNNHVLIIEAQAEDFGLLSRCFAHEEYTLEYIDNIDQAKAVIDRKIPDLIVLGECGDAGATEQENKRAQLIQSIREDVALPYISILVRKDAQNKPDASIGAHPGVEPDIELGIELDIVADGYFSMLPNFDCASFALQARTLVLLGAATRKLAEPLAPWTGAEGENSLTGVKTAVNITGRLDELLSIATRYQRPLSIMICRLEDFQAAEKTWGHEVACAMRDLAAGCLTGDLRIADLMGNSEYEEFLIILPETDGEGALALAKRLIEVIRENPIVLSGTMVHKQHLAIGVADWKTGQLTKKEDLMAEARKALEVAGKRKDHEGAVWLG